MKSRFEYHDEGVCLIIPDEDVNYFEGILLSNRSVYANFLWSKWRKIVNSNNVRSDAE